MKRIMLILMTSVLMLSLNVFAQDDVSIDSSGNVTTGVTNVDGNLEVEGASGEDAIVGRANDTGAAAVYGEHRTEGGVDSYGILGDDTYGVFGTSKNGFAGYFDGDTYVTGSLTVDGSVIGPSIGDITGVTAGTGLTGGGTSGTVTLNADTTVLQSIVSGSCPPGQSIRVISPTGTVTCEVDDNSGGTITGVTAGTGLTGGGTIGTVTLNVDSTVAMDSEIMPTVLANDGPDSTLDADLLDGQHASQIIAAAAVMTPISACGGTINTSGSYYVTGNLSTTGTCITVTAINVTIDLMGFVLTGDVSGTDYGVYINNVSNVEVKNGSITNFFNGVYASNFSFAEFSNRVVNVRAIANNFIGIALNSRSNLVKDCSVAYNGGGGISADKGSIVTNNMAYGNQGTGIFASDNSTVTNNTAYGNRNWGIQAGSGSRIVGNTINWNNDSNATEEGGLYVFYDSYVKDNVLNSNNQNNIYVYYDDNIIEDNLVTDSGNGIYFNSTGNFFANNRASGNTSDYTNTAGNTDGGGNVSF